MVKLLYGKLCAWNFYILVVSIWPTSGLTSVPQSAFVRVWHMVIAHWILAKHVLDFKQKFQGAWCYQLVTELCPRNSYLKGAWWYMLVTPWQVSGDHWPDSLVYLENSGSERFVSKIQQKSIEHLRSSTDIVLCPPHSNTHTHMHSCVHAHTHPHLSVYSHMHCTLANRINKNKEYILDSWYKSKIQ